MKRVALMTFVGIITMMRYEISWPNAMSNCCMSTKISSCRRDWTYERYMH
jgi:hypothetical protein